MAVVLLHWRTAVAGLRLQAPFQRLRMAVWVIVLHGSAANTDLRLLTPCAPPQDHWKKQGSGLTDTLPVYQWQTSFYVHMLTKLFSPLQDERLCINMSFRF